MLLWLWNILSMSEAALFAVPAVLFFTTGAPREIGRLIALVATIVLGEFVKHRLVDDEGLPLSPRPPAAADCNVFCNNGSQAGKPGMPSTHMAVAAAFSTMYWPNGSTILAAALITYVVLMAGARYFKSCHTPEQILVGLVYGIGMGLLANKIEGLTAA